ncbi:uncharacterized protein MELLADRAFT_59813 [Melampsora larici-populina 98AG31]|uniref:Uncharacterized protein n=1 Tax=Melampsora larici-populina (strain 98AG31 / pathotype 3-4-7) TaxID=747676 RepID=F4R8V9_MELLP|nr:uncharacterized protein MELLADRAFT_59813 [Melampsora larici-populina 98AG31]EGG11262.1 hypothetical protein MELLADRAFT_59813 [Melampsora larici-populina 98AG31]
MRGDDCEPLIIEIESDSESEDSQMTQLKDKIPCDLFSSTLKPKSELRVNFGDHIRLVFDLQDLSRHTPMEERKLDTHIHPLLFVTSPLTGQTDDAGPLAKFCYHQHIGFWDNICYPKKPGKSTRNSKDV